MLVFDQLKKNDHGLQIVAVIVLLGVLVLVGGLWRVQIVSSKNYETSQRRQMLRQVRVPAVRGKILDRNGNVLADNKPQYNVNIYFEELGEQFWFEYTNSVKKQYLAANPGKTISYELRKQLVLEARWRVTSNLTTFISTTLQDPRILSQRAFTNHFYANPYIPFTIYDNLNPKQVAIFSEQLSNMRGVDLEVKSVRNYPNGTTAAHIVGFVTEEKEIKDDSETRYNYYIPDYVGQMGAESAFNKQLRGQAGVKTLVVNASRYRQSEEMTFPTVPGEDIRLTIDLELQKDTEKHLANAMYNARGAAVIMDVRNGDILAIASTPTFDPAMYLRRRTPEEMARMTNEVLRPQFNRASFGEYTPGSVFKIVTAFACLESGLNPYEEIDNPGYWQPNRNWLKIDDTAPPGKYAFERAFKKSSNTYFIHYGLQAGLPKIAEVARRFHISEKTGLLTRQEVSGKFPTPSEFSRWTPGRVAQLCIGQQITTTPVQIACMTAAVANGGKLFLPRIVIGAEGASTNSETFPAEGTLRDQIHFNPKHLEIVRHAMLADVEIIDNEEGSGRPAYIPNFKIAGKTGTAEIVEHGKEDKTTWFASYAPYENPRYAVVVMIESGASGGKTCAPVAHEIYKSILKRESRGMARPQMATLN